MIEASISNLLTSIVVIDGDSFMASCGEDVQYIAHGDVLGFGSEIYNGYSVQTR